ncbi:MAG: molybdopterin molybdotransferase MoeA [Chromatiales bacterium]|nr:MAG: molybdopterin molybdotransferase MoeA [Chromatiales bacterium]
MNARRRIDVADAAALVESRLPEYPAVEIPLAAAHRHILRETLHAERDQPPFDRVTMDGIALRSAGLTAGHRRFRIGGTQAAGAAALTLGADDACVEIMTGAMLPKDADTIVPVERIAVADGWATLENGSQPEAGQFIHRRGSDHAGGDVILGAGTRLGVPEMAVLTVAGKTTIRVAQWPRVAVVSTGDELVDIGAPMADFQIRASNDWAIAAALQRRGCERITRARLPDDLEAMRAAVKTLHDDSDVLVLSGGVSMGKYDYVPQIMAELGVELVFHKVLQRPGLPMWFGMSAAGQPVFALPGNPVSSLVCFVRYACPALLKALGVQQVTAPRTRLAETFDFKPDLTCFLPVVLVTNDAGEQLAVPRPTNTSGDFVSLAGSDGFVELPRGQDEFPAGFVAPFYRW